MQPVGMVAEQSRGDSYSRMVRCEVKSELQGRPPPVEPTAFSMGFFGLARRVRVTLMRPELPAITVKGGTSRAICCPRRLARLPRTIGATEPVCLPVAAGFLKSAPHRVPSFAEVERDLVMSALEHTGGNKVAAATLLGISRKKLYAKIAKYQLAFEPGKLSLSGSEK
jgi:hypothetical protein